MGTISNDNTHLSSAIFLCNLDRKTFRVTIVSAGLDQNLGITIYSENFFFQAKAQEEDMGRR